MSFLDFFRKPAEKAKSLVGGFSIGGSIFALYSTDASVFYRFYDRNPYISAVIDRIRSDVGAFGFEITQNGQLHEGSMTDFSQMVHVVLGTTPRSFIKRIVRDYEVTGNAYVYLVRDWEKIVGLQVLDPRYIKPIMSEYGQILGYVQNLNGINIFTKDEIFHLKTDNDLQFEALGRSKMQSLFIDLETDNEARESNLAFFKNNQTPSSLIVLDPDFNLPDDVESEIRFKNQIKDLFESWKYQGGKNRHRSAVIEWVKDVIKLQDKITDAEFLNLRKFSLEMVCAVYGVNKDILGFTETSNRSVGENQSNNYFSLIEEKERLLEEFLTQIIQTIFGKNFSFQFVRDNIRFLLAKSDIASRLYNNGILTLNESRNIIQYEALPHGNTTKEGTQDAEWDVKK